MSINNDMDKKPKDDLDFTNSIENADLDNLNDDYDDVPDVDVTTTRKSSNAKKLKMMGLGVLAMLVVLIASGVTFNRYQEAKAVQKQEEAEQAIANQQNLKTNSARIDIGEEQQEIESQEMYDLPPPPADALTPAEPIMLDTNSGGATPPPTPIMLPEPTPPPSATPAPRGNVTASSQPTSDYSFLGGSNDNDNDNNNGGGGMVDFAPPPPSPEEVRQQRLLKSGVMAYENAGVANAKNAGREPDGSYSATALSNGSASKRGDKTMLLMKGTTIPCVLKSKIVSDYKGFTTCQVTKNVYSANGKVLLIERGSKVFGEQNIEIKQGQGSVFVLWTKVETPKGITVNLESPAVGQLGEMGVKADVNNHFWKRFGGAIMLSLIQDALDVASTKAKGETETKGDNNTTVQNTSNTAQSMAEKALDTTINIPPTATIPQGTLMNILVVRDVDFGGVYGLR